MEGGGEQGKGEGRGRGRAGAQAFLDTRLNDCVKALTCDLEVVAQKLSAVVASSELTEFMAALTGEVGPGLLAVATSQLGREAYTLYKYFESTRDGVRSLSSFSRALRSRGVAERVWARRSATWGATWRTTVRLPFD
jgi:hypothetical protein